jgi:hypothetical protein
MTHADRQTIQRFDLPDYDLRRERNENHVKAHRQNFVT